MKGRNTAAIFFLIGITVVVLAAQVSFAKTTRNDLKSDLELEMEGIGEGSSQTETPKLAPASKRRPTAVDIPTGNDLESRIHRAQIQFDQKQFSSAVESLRPVNDKLSRSGLLLLAKAYGASKNKVDEIKTLELCLAKNQKDYVVQTLLGQALLDIKRFEDGMAALQTAKSLNSRYRPAYDAQIKALETKGERYEARNVINDMINVFGEKPEFYSTLCRLYSLDSFHEKTVEVCEIAIGKDPQNPENHVYLGLSFKEREDLAKAQQILVKASHRFPASEPAQSAMGGLFIEKKDFVSAYSFYKKATVADPQSARAWVGYGLAAFELQKNEEALTAFTRACRVDRTMNKEFRHAIGILRERKETVWQSKFEFAINHLLGTVLSLKY